MHFAALLALLLSSRPGPRPRAPALSALPCVLVDAPAGFVDADENLEPGETLVRALYTDGGRSINHTQRMRADAQRLASSSVRRHAHARVGFFQYRSTSRVFCIIRINIYFL